MAREIQGPLFSVIDASSGGGVEKQTVEAPIFSEDFLEINPKDAQEELRRYWLNRQTQAGDIVRQNGLVPDSTPEAREIFEVALQGVVSNAREAANARKAVLRIKTKYSDDFLTLKIGEVVSGFKVDSMVNLGEVEDGLPGRAGSDTRPFYIASSAEYINASYNVALFTTINDQAGQPEGFQHHTSEQLRILMQETSGGIPMRSSSGAPSHDVPQI